VRWHTSEIPALGKSSRKYLEFKTSLGYKANLRLCLKKLKLKQNQKAGRLFSEGEGYGEPWFSRCGVSFQGDENILVLGRGGDCTM
jgi:hypothetical protein